MVTVAENAALLMIDIQNDFCPGGALAVGDGDTIIPVVNQLQTKFSVRILTQDWHPANHSSFADTHASAEPYSVVQMAYGDEVLWPRHCVQGSIGAEFHHDLETHGADLIIRKGFRTAIDSYSAFFENDKATKTGLAGYLEDRSVTHLVLTGLATDFCVCYSALDAVKSGFEVTVVTDACRAIDLDDSLAKAMTAMTSHGVNFCDAAEISD